MSISKVPLNNTAYLETIILFVIILNTQNSMIDRYMLVYLIII